MNLLAYSFIYLRAPGLISSGKMTLNAKSGMGTLSKYKALARPSSMSKAAKFVVICL
jgi:hypothetical protein